MEISERALAQMTQEVEDLHREGMQTMPSDIAELHSGEGSRIMGESRNNFVRGVGMGGIALAIGAAVIPMSSLWNAAYAANSSDVAIAKFAASVELAAVAAYVAAAKTGKVTGQGLATAEAFAKQHQDHANAFSGFAGDGKTAKANPKLLSVVGGEITKATTATAIVKIAYGLENAAASTYLFAIGALKEKAALALTATILPVESQHATIWGTTLGMSLAEIIPPFLKTTGYVNPATYPIKPGS